MMAGKYGSSIIKKGSSPANTRSQVNTKQNTLDGVTVTAKSKKKAPKGVSKLSVAGASASTKISKGPKKTTNKKVAAYEKAKAKASKSGKARHYRKANRKYKRLTK